MKRTYWSFYWPLAVTGTAIILANQFQNGALARYPNATFELASYAYAFSTFSLFRSALVFVPQMANLLARSRHAHRVMLGFLIVACLVLMTPLVFVGVSPLGAELVSRLFEIRGAGLERVLDYLKYLAPLILVFGLRQYGIGLLIQVHATRLVTALDLVNLGTLFAVLVLGYRSGWSPVTTLVSAQWFAGLAHVALLAVALLRAHRFEEDERGTLTSGEIFRFFWPVAITSMMFTVSRPLIYAFVSRGAEGVATVAALRIAFDFALFFHQPLNQFRNLFATFGTKDLAGLRRFQIEIVAAITLLMGLLSLSPLDTWVFSNLLGIEGDVLVLAEGAFFVMCLLPVVVGVRNYFHGIALAGLTTRAMAYASVLRVLSIYLAAWLAHGAGVLDHRSASAILVLGFAVEALAVILFLRLR